MKVFIDKTLFPERPDDAREEAEHWKRLARFWRSMAEIHEQAIDDYENTIRVREAADLDTAGEGKVFCLSRRRLCELQDQNPGGARMGHRSHRQP